MLTGTAILLKLGIDNYMEGSGIKKSFNEINEYDGTYLPNCWYNSTTFIKMWSLETLYL